MFSWMRWWAGWQGAWQVRGGSLLRNLSRNLLRNLSRKPWPGTELQPCGGPAHQLLLPCPVKTLQGSSHC
jgi:hypothetical protein